MMKLLVYFRTTMRTISGTQRWHPEENCIPAWSWSYATTKEATRSLFGNLLVSDTQTVNQDCPKLWIKHYFSNSYSSSSSSFKSKAKSFKNVYIMNHFLHSPRPLPLQGKPLFCRPSYIRCSKCCIPLPANLAAADPQPNTLIWKLLFIFVNCFRPHNEITKPSKPVGSTRAEVIVLGKWTKKIKAKEEKSTSGLGAKTVSGPLAGWGMTSTRQNWMRYELDPRGSLSRSLPSEFDTGSRTPAIPSSTAHSTTSSSPTWFRKAMDCLERRAGRQNHLQWREEVMFVAQSWPEVPLVSSPRRGDSAVILHTALYSTNIHGKGMWNANPQTRRKKKRIITAVCECRRIKMKEWKQRKCDKVGFIIWQIIDKWACNIFQNNTLTTKATDAGAAHSVLALFLFLLVHSFVWAIELTVLTMYPKF